MEFPEDVLRIIKEYSMPLTRTDWRICGKINQHLYETECKKVIMQRHYKILTCKTEDYIKIYHNYKPLFQICKYPMFHNL